MLTLFTILVESSENFVVEHLLEMPHTTFAIQEQQTYEIRLTLFFRNNSFGVEDFPFGFTMIMKLVGQQI